ncbi:putative 1,4-dihydroxy-2-naphthoate octaprenyltransferase [Limosilactobacillus vaginalis DSM 5837 = ATCC 49540]|uniref:Putative 1,4-dihydroxy-2-naphthoate octaprenyltransferase n=1 Tax=Limosilactobacillus vaginalis DSM 5837 = ATCC 49540 TaxID=1423814 RepID=C2EWI7_9LACO|nr:putative 1,4-dihydroxy-2-naphthoate octaprenyltransferase [Limosilactobacillus vaginalis DSM 5837 = ATCC 49540]
MGSMNVSLDVFLELVEIKAKTASILPMLLGVCMSVYYYHSFNLINSILFFIAMLLFNMAVDMMDNYNDYNHAVDTEDYKKNTNIIGREKISPRLVLTLILIFSIIAAGIGIYLVTRVGLPLLWMGIFCFAVGILYSSGPFPMNGLPVGEFFSGFTMGFMIMLISVYINKTGIFDWSWSNLLKIWLVALPCELWISNLMLANNICDAQEDEDNHRHTIIHFIGVQQGLNSFTTKNVIAFLAIITAVMARLAPWTMLLTLLIIPFVVKQTKLLYHEQVKKRTFPCAVKILLVGSLAQVITYGVGVL